MLITIVTVVRNNARGLRMTGRSLAVQQNAPEFEWLIIDGASTDNTADIVAEFSDLNPVFVSEPDKGLYDAMNKGIERATGEYIWFMNGGDCLSDAYVMKDVAWELRSAFRPDFLYGDVRETDGIKIAKDFDAMKRGLITSHQSMLYRRAAIGDMRYDTQYKIAADYAFTLQVAGRSEKLHYFPRVMCDFEPGGISAQQVQLGRDENYRIRRDILCLPEWRNRLYYGMDSATYWLRQKMPAIYRFFRARRRPASDNKFVLRAHMRNRSRHPENRAEG